MASSWQAELRRTWSAACGGAVRAVLLSPRDVVAAVTASGISLFDGPPSFALRRELRGQAAGLTAAAFSCKGTDVVSGGADGFLKWWQVDSGEELCSTQFPLGDGAAAAAAPLAPGGQPQPADPAIPEVACSKGGYAAAASGRLLCIFGPGGEHLHTLDASGDGSLQHVTWLDESTVLGCCGAEATIWRVDAESYEEVGAYGTTPRAHIGQLAISPDGRYLAAACGNGTVRGAQGGAAVAGSRRRRRRAPAHAVAARSSVKLQPACRRQQGDCCAATGALVRCWQARPSRARGPAARPAAPQVQVWDTQREGSMDPFLVISEGVDGPVAALSWDASSRLLAAAVGSEALVWEVPGAKEGQPEASYVCIGFEQGSRITCLAFQHNGTLLVRQALFLGAAGCVCTAGMENTAEALDGQGGCGRGSPPHSTGRRPLHQPWPALRGALTNAAPYAGLRRPPRLTTASASFLTRPRLGPAASPLASSPTSPRAAWPATALGPHPTATRAQPHPLIRARSRR